MNSNLKSNEKIESLQGLRTIAFLMVFLLHTGLTDTGEIGVSIFFVLSGFVYYLSYRSRELSTSVKDLFAFSLGKIKRLYPLHIITMLGFLYFEIKMIVENFNVGKVISTLWKTLLNCLLLQVWSPQEETFFSLNAVAWYLAVSMFLYLLFPLILKVMKGYKGMKNAVVAIVVALVLMAVSSMIVSKVPVPESVSNYFIRWFTYIFPLYRLGDFVIGCNLAYIFVVSKENGFNLSPAVASLGEAVAFAALFAAYELRRYGVFIFGNNFVRFNLVYLPITMAIVLLLAFDRGLISKVLSLKVIGVLGTLSSFAFLIHSLVIKYYFDIFCVNELALKPYVATPAIFVITILLAYLYSIVTKRRSK